MRRTGTLLRGLGLGIVVGLAASAAGAANIISFAAMGDGSVRKNDIVNVAVNFDFGDTTVGGGVNITFSRNDFKFKSFTFDANLGDDPSFRLKPADDSDADPIVIAFGNFAGLSGRKTIGTLQLIANQDLRFGSGRPGVDGANNTDPAGPFFSDTNQELAVTYVPLEAQVPEPGTLLLLAAGLTGLGIVTRRRDD